MKDRILDGFLAVLAAALLASCGGGGGSLLVSVSISPTSARVALGTTQQFTANVVGATNSAVTWQVNGVAGGNDSVGTVSSAGLYTAPSAIPSPANVTVTAVSQAASAKSGSAAVTVVGFSDATLNGQYSFLLTGDDSFGDFLGVGSFTADGRGKLSNGFEDLNSSTGYLENMELSGSYTVGEDGRGTLSLKNSQGTQEFSLVVISSSRARFAEFNASSNGEALLLKRDPTAFSAAAISGNYAFGLGGSDIGGAPASLAGVFNANGTGGLTGTEDANLAGTVTAGGSLSGTYTVDAKGRGTAAISDALGNVNFVFHVVNQDTLFFIETDYPFPAVDGTAKRQQQAMFSNSSLKGDYAFLFSGITPAAVPYIATAGRFTSDGAAGTLNISSGALDQNDSGTVSAGVSFTGSGSVSSNGRGTVTLTGGATPLAFYMVSASEAFVISEDPNAVASGTMLAQTGGPFDSNPPSGSFAFLFYTSTSDTDQVGQMMIAGGRNGGNLTGTGDINEQGILTSDAAFSGTYSVSSNGRAAASVTSPLGSANLAFYVVSGSRLFVVSDDASEVTSGNFEKQY
jgi:hypothetical protein